MSDQEPRLIDCKIATKFREYMDVYEVDGETYGIVGMDLRTLFEIGWMPGVSIEPLPHYCSDMFETQRMEKLFKQGGNWDEYLQALTTAGTNIDDASAEQRCRALLEVDYTFPGPPEEIVDAVYEPAVVATVPREVVVAPALAAEVEKPAEVEPKRELPQLPDDWWLTYTADERVPVIFQDKNGAIERIEATWVYQDNLFELKQTPLRVDGVSYYDCIEVKWEPGDLTPIFDRIHEKGGYGTIRLRAGKLSRKSKQTLKQNLAYEISDVRYDGELMVFSYWAYHYRKVVGHLNWHELDWEFADEVQTENDEDDW